MISPIARARIVDEGRPQELKDNFGSPNLEEVFAKVVGLAYGLRSFPPERAKRIDEGPKPRALFATQKILTVKLGSGD